jgi:hypothetical protein
VASVRSSNDAFVTVESPYVVVAATVVAIESSDAGNVALSLAFAMAVDAQAQVWAIVIWEKSSLEDWAAVVVDVAAAAAVQMSANADAK